MAEGEIAHFATMLSNLSAANVAAGWKRDTIDQGIPVNDFRQSVCKIHCTAL